MKYIYSLLFVSLLVFLVACGKENYETKPRIEIKEITPTVVGNGQTVKFVLQYFDKEGDMGDGQFFCAFERMNRLRPPENNMKIDTFNTGLPEFADQMTGEINFELPQSSLREHITQNDSLKFSFAVIDRKGNKSDTIKSSVIVITD